MFHINHKYKYEIIFFKILILFIKIEHFSFDSCSYDAPFLKNQKCFEGYCSPQDFKDNKCSFNNTIIETQWFNNILQVSTENYSYIDIITMLNGDLLIETSSHPKRLRREFFGIKKNGRPYFMDKENKETTNRTIDTSYWRFESYIFGIKLNGTTDEEEYLVSMTKDHTNCIELYDFKNNITYEKVIKTFFFNLQVLTLRTSIIKLRTDDDYYILPICGILYSPNKSTNFYLIKFLFTSEDIVNNDPIVGKVKTASSESRTVNCFQTNKNYIICFYQNATLDYIIGVYDYDLNNKASLNIYKGSSGIDIFFKSVHFKGEVGAFGYYYYDEEKKESYLYMQFKEFNNETNSISDYFKSLSLIKVEKAGNLSNITLHNDIIKISDSKICFCVYHSSLKKFFIIIINNYYGEKIKIRYFYSNLYNLYNYRYANELEATIYNNLLALSMSFKKDGEIKKGFLLLFSYPNSTDFDVDITEELKQFKNMIINPKEKCLIENNLFGYVYYGIRIVNYTDGYQILFNGIEIGKSSDLYNCTEIELVLSKKINYPINGRIEYAMILEDNSYEKYNKFSPIIDIDYCDGGEDEKEIYNNNINKYVGRISYINIIIDSDEITYSCINDNNCEVCLT